MTKTEQLDKMTEKNNGYLFTSEVVDAGISKTYLSKYVKENKFERAAQGIYVSDETWIDELYVIQKSNPILIFDMDTALYLHGLTDREYSKIHVSVPKGYNTFRLKEKGLIIHTYDDELYQMGICDVESNYGNLLKTYDKERAFCDFDFDNIKELNGSTGSYFDEDGSVQKKDKGGIEGDSEAELREAFEKLYDRCLQDINEGDESSYIFKHHISRIEQQLSYYDRTYAWQDDKDQAVVDYIASMTDGYFCELTSKLFPGLKFPHRTYINER